MMPRITNDWVEGVVLLKFFLKTKQTPIDRTRIYFYIVKTEGSDFTPVRSR